MHSPLNHSENIAPGGIDESRIKERFKLALLAYNFHFMGLPLR
jgi:predicted methyltransferase MtxX (methanogen marker protein 4)